MEGGKAEAQWILSLKEGLGEHLAVSRDLGLSPLVGSQHSFHLFVTRGLLPMGETSSMGADSCTKHKMGGCYASAFRHSLKALPTGIQA